MNCREFQDRMDTWFDQPALGGSAAFLQDPAVAGHLSECHFCREAWEEMQLLGEALPVWSAPVPQVEFKDRVLAALRTTPLESGEAVVARPSSEPAAARSRWIRAAVAALLLAGLGTGFSLWRGQQRDPNSGPGIAVNSPLQNSQTAGNLNQAGRPSDSERVVATATPLALSTSALFRETAIAVTGAADALIPLNRAIVSAPPRHSGDESRATGSEIVKRDEETPPFSQQLRDTLEDLVLPAEALETPQT